MIEIRIGLYGKPSWDMELEGKDYLDPNILRNQGITLKEHLHEVASIVEKLQSNDWQYVECYGAIYDVVFCKDISRDDAKKELKQLKIGLTSVNLEEFNDEGEEVFAA